MSDPLSPNAVLYQVLTPAPMLAPNGDVQYAMLGPFADLASASQHSAKTPGALLAVTVILFQTPALRVPLIPANK